MGWSDTNGASSLLRCWLGPFVLQPFWPLTACGRLARIVSPFCTDTRGIRKSLDTLPRLFMANRPLWDISVDCSAVALAVLRTRPPVGEEGQAVRHANETVVVEVGRAAGVKALWFSNIHD